MRCRSNRALDFEIQQIVSKWRSGASFESASSVCSGSRLPTAASKGRGQRGNVWDFDDFLDLLDDDYSVYDDYAHVGLYGDDDDDDCYPWDY